MIEFLLQWFTASLIVAGVALCYWLGHRSGYNKGRSSMWNYCRELKKNLEAETEAKDRARKDAGDWRELADDFEASTGYDSE